jgi:VWFA-related protein
VGLAIRRVSVLLLFLFLLAPSNAQERGRKEQTADDVVRVQTELVQTDLTVLDKRGRFVAGLPREQFELRVDGRVVPVSFFEQVTAGSAEEESKLAAARGAGNSGDASKPGRRVLPPSPRGRVIFFFVDDVHLSPDSLSRTRTSLTRFVDEQMAAGDLVAIVSTSGRIGFLQQLTDNKAVLHAAIERLFYKRETEAYAGKVPISEADANRIANHRDRELFAFLYEAMRNEYQIGGLGIYQMLRNRLQQINAQTGYAEKATLSTLEGLMRSSGALAGRKLVFFISDGFISDYRKSNGPDFLRLVTEEAARVGAVVYTLDARGTMGDPAVDASRNDYPDFAVRANGRSFFDERMTKEPLETIAEETGGRAFLNNNAFNDVFAQAVGETSNYYLLAWRPDTDEQRARKSRVSVTIKGRPDLRVQMRRRFVNTSAEAKAAKPASASKTARGKGEAPSQPSVDDELRTALASLYPVRDLPLALSVGYLDLPEKGTTLTASMQLDGETLNFGEGAQDADSKLDVWGIALDDRGSFATFRQVLTIPRDASVRGNQRFVVWNQQLQLPPGLYQVRVAARERRSGRTGSQLQWVEIPETGAGAIALSSVFIGELKPATAGEAQRRVAVSVSRRFSRGSSLRYQTYVYGAAARVADPDLTLVLSVMRDGQTVLTLPAARLPKDGAKDPARILFAGDLSLENLPAGRYVLQISLADARAKSEVTQQTSFVLE